MLQPNVFEDADTTWAVFGNATMTAAEKIVSLALLRDVFDQHRELTGMTERIATAVSCDTQTVRRAITRLSGPGGLFLKRVGRTQTQYGWESYIDLHPRYADTTSMLRAAGELRLKRPQWGGYRMAAS